ncbi:jerky protein homolog-like [Fukomys damarensis]|uniref:jerky protein homolog-like n=1 Tax=Fukomys damarensis TaxID=885580 RepID=UPI00053FEF77|nr:jerky protein homolog-like [Fukomys damarensis]
MAPPHTKATAKMTSKRPRRVIDLETKLKLIQDYEGGKPVMVIARQSGMSHSTIATILKNRNKVTEALRGSASLKATRLTKIREGPISDMEKLLMTWIEDQTRQCVPLSTMMITAKAKSLFAMLKEKAGPGYNVEFSASSGWLKRFKNRYSLHDVKAGTDVPQERVPGIWKKTLRRFVHDFRGLAAAAEEEEAVQVSEAVAKVTGSFPLGTDEDDIKEVLEVPPKGLAREELLGQGHKARELDSTRGDRGAAPRKFTVTGLAEAFSDLNQLLKKFQSMDPNPERFSAVERGVRGALSAYERIYDAKRKQKGRGAILKGGAQVGETQAGPSGAIPEGGIIIIADDGTMRVIAPEGLAMGRSGEHSTDVSDPDHV